VERRVVVDRQDPRVLCDAEAVRSIAAWGRAGAPSATWTALPPMMAPPHVQAQSFARAILTDITASLFQTVRVEKMGRDPSSSPVRPSKQMQTIGLSASALTILSPENARIRACYGAFVPLLHSFFEGVNDGLAPISARHG
jgi:hypothetical protein